jgi:hypothetical protein
MSAHELKKLASVSTSTLDDIANKPASAFKSLSEVMNDVKKDEKDLETRGESLGKTQDNQARRIQEQVNKLQEVKKGLDKVSEAFGGWSMAMASATGAIISFGGQYATLKMMQSLMLGTTPGGKGMVPGMTGAFKSLGQTMIAVGGLAITANAAMSKEKTGANAAQGAMGGAMAGGQIGFWAGGPIGAMVGGAIGAGLGAIASYADFATGTVVSEKTAITQANKNFSKTSGSPKRYNEGINAEEIIPANAMVRSRKDEKQPLTVIVKQNVAGKPVGEQKYSSDDMYAAGLLGPVGKAVIDFTEEINLNA